MAAVYMVSWWLVSNVNRRRGWRRIEVLVPEIEDGLVGWSCEFATKRAVWALGWDR